MTPQEIREVLKRIRYKPEWFFTLDASDDVLITARVRDAYHRGHRTRIYGHVPDPHRCTEMSLLEAIFKEVKWLEAHEAAEWFKYRRRRPFDPHA